MDFCTKQSWSNASCFSPCPGWKWLKWEEQWLCCQRGFSWLWQGNVSWQHEKPSSLQRSAEQRTAASTLLQKSGWVQLSVLPHGSPSRQRAHRAAGSCGAPCPPLPGRSTVVPYQNPPKLPWPNKSGCSLAFAGFRQAHPTLTLPQNRASSEVITGLYFKKPNNQCQVTTSFL